MCISDVNVARISHWISPTVADPGLSTAFGSVELLGVLSQTLAEASFACLVSTPFCAASLRNLVRKAG